jgi:hypothetical protein
VTDNFFASVSAAVYALGDAAAAPRMSFAGDACTMRSRRTCEKSSGKTRFSFFASCCGSHPRECEFDDAGARSTAGDRAMPKKILQNC